MFERLRRWWEGSSPEPPPQGPLPQTEPGDWVVLPYRIAEACRLSMCIISQHPDMPKHLHWWITQWLAGYNGALTMWFEQNYGKEIFPVLQEITNGVRSASDQALTEQYERSVGEAFEKWESQFTEGDEDATGR